MPIYNYPYKRKNREFLEEHHLGLEYTVRVKDGKESMAGNPELAKKAGNRQYGFALKRGFVPITTGLDGQYIKVKKTACRPRKRVYSRLLTNKEIRRLDLMSDPVVREEILKSQAGIREMKAKALRKENRNYRARNRNK